MPPFFLALRLALLILTAPLDSSITLQDARHRLNGSVLLFVSFSFLHSLFDPVCLISCFFYQRTGKVDRYPDTYLEGHDFRHTRVQSFKPRDQSHINRYDSNWKFGTEHSLKFSEKLYNGCSGRKTTRCPAANFLIVKSLIWRYQRGGCSLRRSSNHYIQKEHDCRLEWSRLEDSRPLLESTEHLDLWLILYSILIFLCRRYSNIAFLVSLSTLMNPIIQMTLSLPMSPPELEGLTLQSGLKLFGPKTWALP